jgi:hypothetical protein
MGFFIGLVLLSQKVAIFCVENQLFGEIHIRQGAEMGLPRLNDDEARFSAYLEGLTSVIGHAGVCVSGTSPAFAWLTRKRVCYNRVELRCARRFRRLRHAD